MAAIADPSILDELDDEDEFGEAEELAEEEDVGFGNVDEFDIEEILCLGGEAVVSEDVLKGLREACISENLKKHTLQQFAYS